VWHATRIATGFAFGYAMGAAAACALLRDAPPGSSTPEVAHRQAPTDQPTG
jgi:hypothetical protein